MEKITFFKDSFLDLNPSPGLWVEQVFFFFLHYMFIFLFFNFFCPFPLQELKNEVWEYSSYVICFVNDQFLGNALDLQKWAHKVWDIVDFKPAALYDALAMNYSIKFLQDTKASYTNF